MCDECTWHHKTFLVQSVYWHLAINVYCIVYCIKLFTHYVSFTSLSPYVPVTLTNCPHDVVVVFASSPVSHTFTHTHHTLSHRQMHTHTTLSFSHTHTHTHTILSLSLSHAHTHIPPSPYWPQTVPSRASLQSLTSQAPHQMWCVPLCRMAPENSQEEGRH